MRIGQIRTPHRHERRLGRTAPRHTSTLRLRADAVMLGEHCGERGPRDREVLQCALGLGQFADHPRCLPPQRLGPRAHDHLVRIEQPVHRDHDRLPQLTEPSPRHCHSQRRLTHPQQHYLPSSDAIFGKTTRTQMHWAAGEHEVAPELRQERLASVMTKYAGSWYLTPALGGNDRPLHPLMAWWAVLFTLNLSR
jgi:hypothetical protein